MMTYMNSKDQRENLQKIWDSWIGNCESFWVRINVKEFNFRKSEMIESQLFQRVSTLYASIFSSFVFLKVVIKGVHLPKNIHFILHLIFNFTSISLCYTKIGVHIWSLSFFSVFFLVQNFVLTRNFLFWNRSYSYLIFAHEIINRPQTFAHLISR